MAEHPYPANVKALIHFDGGITDVLGHTFSATGGGGSNTALFKFGTGSYTGTATGSVGCFHDDFIVPVSGDFTFEGWVYITESNSYETFYPFVDMGGYRVGIYGDFGQQWIGGRRRATSSTLYTSQAVELNVWRHVEMSRASNTLRIFYNGVMIYKYVGDSSTTNLYQTVQVVATDSSVLKHRFDEFCLCIGVALHGTDTSFTPPTSAYTLGPPSISGTTLNASSAPFSTSVRAYNRLTGELAGTATSNATTGAFSITPLEEVAHYVVCLPESTAENALVFDNITPS